MEEVTITDLTISYLKMVIAKAEYYKEQVDLGKESMTKISEDMRFLKEEAIFLINELS